MSATLDRPTSAVDPTRGARLNEKMRAERRLGWYLAGPAFVVMLLVTAYPIVQAVFDSLFDYRLTDPENSSFVGLGNYGVILTDSVWWTSFGVTAFIKLVEVIVDGEPRDLQPVRSRLDTVFEQEEAATAQFIDYAELVIFTHETDRHANLINCFAHQPGRYLFDVTWRILVAGNLGGRGLPRPRPAV